MSQDEYLRSYFAELGETPARERAWLAPELREWRLAALSPELQHLAGSTLDGRFVVGAVLARGGFATVTAGKDVQQEGMPCAVKIFRRELLDNEWLERHFRQEVQVLASIRHPNIVAKWGGCLSTVTTIGCGARSINPVKPRIVAAGKKIQGEPMVFKPGDKVERYIKARSHSIDGAMEAWLPCTVVEVVPAGERPTGEYPWYWDAKKHDWCIVEGDDDGFFLFSTDRPFTHP